MCVHVCACACTYLVDVVVELVVEVVAASPGPVGHEDGAMRHVSDEVIEHSVAGESRVAAVVAHDEHAPHEEPRNGPEGTRGRVLLPLGELGVLAARLKQPHEVGRTEPHGVVEQHPIRGPKHALLEALLRDGSHHLVLVHGGLKFRAGGGGVSVISFPGE